MMLLWIPLPASVPSANLIQTEDRKAQLPVVSPQLKLTGIPHYHSGYAEYTTGSITYGQSSISADHILLFKSEQAPSADFPDGVHANTAIARGHVILSDPLGVVQAEDLTFNWDDHTATAHNALINLDGLNVRAGTAHITVDAWVLSDVDGNGGKDDSRYNLHAKRLVIYPGRKAVAYRLRLDAFGRKLLVVKRQEFQLDNRISGLHYPSLTYDGKRGLGLSFNSSILVDPATALAGSYSASPKDLPSYGIQLSESFIAPGQVNGLITPRSELDERFAYGYYDHALIPNTDAEHSYIDAKRDTLSLGSFANVSTTDRIGNEIFTKPWELTYERSLALQGGYVTLSQLRFQDIHLEQGADHYRFLGSTTIMSPSIYLAKQWRGRVRVDGSTFQGGGTSFSWLHAEAGATYLASKNLRFGGAYVNGGQYGDPLYQADQLYSDHGFNFRADLQYGPRRFSLIEKYDQNRGRFYDRDILIGQLAGPVEPYIEVRTFPSQFRFGIELRFDSLLETLRDRNPQRPPKETSTSGF